MASKNLAIREDVYRKLSEAKKDGDSFSDVIEKLLERRGDLLSLGGAWHDGQHVACIEISVKKMRKKSVVRTRQYWNAVQEPTLSARGRSPSEVLQNREV